MVEKPIKKSERAARDAEQGTTEAPRSEERRGGGDRPQGGRGGKGGGRGKGRGDDREETKAPVNPAFMRGPKPPKPSAAVEEVAEPETEATEAAEATEAEATEAAAE